MLISFVLYFITCAFQICEKHLSRNLWERKYPWNRKSCSSADHLKGSQWLRWEEKFFAFSNWLVSKGSQGLRSPLKSRRGSLGAPWATTQEKTLHVDITRWSTPKSDWLYSLQPKMEKLYTVNKTRPGADCGSDHELLITKFRLKLKKVGKTTRPFRYDLNQIPYDYTVEVR